MPALNKLYRDYRGRAAFYVVYIEEAHPIDAWQIKDNLEDDVLVASTTSNESVKVANVCVKNLGIELPAWLTRQTIGSSARTPAGRIGCT